MWQLSTVEPHKAHLHVYIRWLVMIPVMLYTQWISMTKSKLIWTVMNNYLWGDVAVFVEFYFWKWNFIIRKKHRRRSSVGAGITILFVHWVLSTKGGLLKINKLIMIDFVSRMSILDKYIIYYLHILWLLLLLNYFALWMQFWNMHWLNTTKPNQLVTGYKEPIILSVYYSY